MQKALALLFFLHFFAFKGFCQGIDISNNDVVLKNKKEADKHFAKGDYKIAFNKYEKIAVKYSSDPEFNFKYGICILNTNYNKEKAIPFFELAASKGNIEAFRMLGITYHEIYKFDEALAKFNKYISSSDTNSAKFRNSNIRRLIEYSKVAKELVENPVDVKIENLGDKVNSTYADYAPIVTADDQEIVFTSRRPTSTGGVLDHNDEFFEDIFYAQRDSTGVWQHSRHISGDLNSHAHDAVAGLSADGQTLLVYQNDPLGNGGDLYVSYLRDTNWTSPIKLSNQISRNDSWEPSAALTANEDAIYFSSNRPGGFGGLDLYMAKRQSSGEYGTPVNLGKEINSNDDEDAPFISADGFTLYFSSKGHKNMGGYDVFKSDKKADGLGWSKPQNMGYPINTPDDDVFFTINAEGTHGYYSSFGADSYGEKDIYQIKFKPKQKTLAVLKGKVTNLKNEPVLSQVYVYKANSPKLNGLFNSNASSGKYLIVLQPGFSYQIIFSAKNYYEDTLLINAQEFVGFNEVIKNIKLRKIEEKIPDSAKIIPKEILVIGKKDTLKPLLLEQAIAVNTPKLLLVDTNGNQKEIPRNRLKNNDTLQTKGVRKEPVTMELDQSEQKGKSASKKFTKDCNIDFTDNVNVVSFNFGYKMLDLNAPQYIVLDSLLNSFKKKIIGIKINTHTDHIGSVRYNMLLSQKRANSIAKHLQVNGIKSHKIVACFFGETKPLFPNQFEDGTDNPENRFKNRRAEIEFYLK